MDEMRLYYLVERAVGNLLSDAERYELEAWVAESDENAAEFAEIADILGFTQSALEAVAPDTDAEWVALQAKLREGARETQRETKREEAVVVRPPFWSGARVWAAAAAVAMLVAVGGYFAFFKADEVPNNGFRYATAVGERKEFKLSDGSLVTLQGGSKIFAENVFGLKDRQIELVGEAYFKVAKDKTRPFIVKAGATHAEALGTEFNVRSRMSDNYIVLSVTEGTVRFTGSPNAEMTLVAGEVANYDSQTGKMTKDTTDAKEDAAWKEDKLVFNDTPIHEVCERLEAHYGTKIRFPSRLVQARLTATFDRKPLSEVLDVLEATFNLKARQSGKSLVTLSE